MLRARTQRPEYFFIKSVTFVKYASKLKGMPCGSESSLLEVRLIERSEVPRVLGHDYSV